METVMEDKGMAKELKFNSNTHRVMSLAVILEQ
jgi:hypothetical protein